MGQTGHVEPGLAWAMVTDRLAGTVELLADGEAVTVVAPTRVRRWWRRGATPVTTLTIRRRGDAFRVEVPGSVGGGGTHDLGPDRVAAVDLVVRTLAAPGVVPDPARVTVGRPRGPA